MEVGDIFYRPEESYFYFPKNQMLKDKRLVFYGKVNHTPKQTKFITAFKQYLKKIKSDMNPSDQKIVLFGYDKDFKPQKTYQAIKQDDQWRKTHTNIPLTPQIQQILQSGIIYVTGRDHLYRPIVVMNLNLFDQKKTDLIILSFSYFFDQVISKILIPGQVQQWVTIMNIKGFSLFSLPLGGGKKLLNHLETHYRGSLAKLYLVNCPSAVWISWKIVKQFLQDSTVQKVDIVKDNQIKQLYKHANKSQIQKQFGGTQNDRTIFWPGQRSANDFLSPDCKFQQLHISRQQYLNRIPTLGHDIIHPQFTLGLSKKKQKQPEPTKLMQKKIQDEQPICVTQLKPINQSKLESSELDSQNIPATIKITYASNNSDAIENSHETFPESSEQQSKVASS